MFSESQTYLCSLPLIPLRAEPSDKSEMISQLLFGEKFKITEKENNWYKIVSLTDNYNGWCQIKKQLLAGEEHSISPVSFATTTLLTNSSDSTTMHVPAGSFIDALLLKNESLTFPENIATVQEKTTKFNPAFAMQFLNSPYLWGGKTLMGIDCSGLTQIVMRLHGFNIQRDASQQVMEGSLVDFVEEVLPGDLAFFGNDEGQIIHTGILLDTKQILHASGFVRIDAFDQNGIFNRTENKYSHNLRTIKRVLL